MSGPRLKDVKVTLPMATYRKLVRLKVLEGQPIQATVERALELYFASAARRGP